MTPHPPKKFMISGRNVPVGTFGPGSRYYQQIYRGQPGAPFRGNQSSRATFQTTPFSEGPTSPVPLMAPCPSPMMISPPSQLPPPPMMYPQCYEPMLHPHHHQHYAPPPYPTKDSYLQGPEYHQLPQMMMAPEQQGLPNAVLLEEVVKMVVSAMKQSSLTGGEESPEEILRRKRNQADTLSIICEEGFSEQRGRREVP